MKVSGPRPEACSRFRSMLDAVERRSALRSSEGDFFRGAWETEERMLCDSGDDCATKLGVGLGQVLYMVAALFGRYMLASASGNCKELIWHRVYCPPRAMFALRSP
jgi:hypothetical protein